MSGLRAPGLPADRIRRRARDGAAAAFPDRRGYGTTVYGAGPGAVSGDALDALRLVPPAFVPRRLDRLIELGREPLYTDVALDTVIGGFRSPLPVYLSALGSTQVASDGLGQALAAQAGRLGIPMVIGENLVPVTGYGADVVGAAAALLARARAYAGAVPDGVGGVVVQQSTEDADAEVWNLVYTDPALRPLLESGRLGFELKLGQGAKPGLGGMTLLPRARAAALAGHYALDPAVYGPAEDFVLRSSSPGTFTRDILTHQIRLMRNNYPRCRVWAKTGPTRDVAEVVATAWAAGADAVTVDGAEGGTGWAPQAFLDQVGLPLDECLRRIAETRVSENRVAENRTAENQDVASLLVSGRIWEGARAAKCLALGGRAVGLGRAALIAADEDPEHGLARLVDCLAFELRALTSAVGKYTVAELDTEDVWRPTPSAVTTPITERSDVDGLRERVLDELRSALSSEDFTGALDCARRLWAQLAERGPAAGRKVLVAFGGGKDSAYTLAFVRAMQLLLYRIHRETFAMRVVTMRHAGVSAGVMANIQRAFDALGLPEDPDVEMLLVDGNELGPFHRDKPLPAEVAARNRLDVLMTGHRTFGDGRPTFCNACNLSVANAFGLAAAYDGGVDLIITGDSPEEQRSYGLWIRRLARQFGLLPTDHAGRAGFRGVLTTLNNIGTAYFTEIHGTGEPALLADRAVATDVPRQLAFFSIYHDTAYASGDHWSLLTDYLGFEFTEDVFNFTESDCGNPALMAHLRALKVERVYGRDYRDGLLEYVDFALALMRRKEIPERLVDMMAQRYLAPGAAQTCRARANQHALAAFGLSERQLICLVHAPFVNRGARLETYLAAENPQLRDWITDIHRLLDGAVDGAELPGVVTQLEHDSGLTVAQLRSLYQDVNSSVNGNGAGARRLLPAILDGDPHQSNVRTRTRPAGPIVTERISGR